MQSINNLINKYSRLDQISKEYNLDDEVKEFVSKNSDLLRRGKENLESNNFNITVIAPMKAGKSTFINTLLGEELLPNESEACTFFPIEINVNAKDSSIYRVFSNGENKKIGDTADYNKLYNDIKKLRNGELVIDDLDKYVLGYDMKNMAIPEHINIKIIDLPGINEAKDENNANIVSMFDKVLKNSNQIIYLFDIQYYKAAENVDILNRIKLTRPDLVDDILFVLTKIDIFNYDKGKTLEDTKQDIQRVLDQIGIMKANIVECSSKQELIANNIQKAYDKDKSDFAYNLLNKCNISFIKNISKKISKAEKLVNENSEYITQNVALKRVEQDGKSILILPEVDEIINQMKLKSQFHNVVDQVQDIVDNYSVIKARSNNKIYELVNDDLKQVISVLKEESQNEVHTLMENDKLKKFKTLNESANSIKMLTDYGQGNIDAKQIEMKLEELVRDEMRGMKVKAYYNTDWYQYEDNVYDIELTTPGRYKEDLECEASRNYNNLISAIYRNIDGIIQENKEIVMNNAKKHVDQINKSLQQIYQENNIKFNDMIRLNVPTNSITAIEIPRYFTPYVTYESKSVSKEVGWINKRTVYHRKFRLYQVGEFKNQCMMAGEEAVGVTSRIIAEKLNVNLPKAINESIRSQLNNHIEVMNNVINDRKSEVTEITNRINELNRLIGELDECSRMEYSELRQETNLDVDTKVDVKVDVKVEAKVDIKANTKVKKENIIVRAIKTYLRTAYILMYYLFLVLFTCAAFEDKRLILFYEVPWIVIGLLTGRLNKSVFKDKSIKFRILVGIGTVLICWIVTLTLWY